MEERSSRNDRHRFTVLKATDPREAAGAHDPRPAINLMRCAGRMDLIGTVDEPAVIHRILAHLALPSARDDPTSAGAVSPPRDDQPAPRFALPS